MGLFRKFREPVEPDPALPMFDDGHDAARFAGLARRIFAENGIECHYRKGSLQGANGQTYGLANVAMIAANSSERDWSDLLARHVRGLVAAHATPRVRDINALRDRMFLRLWPTGEVPQTECVETLAPGLVGLASIDHPEHVETITGAHDIELLGGWGEIRSTALANLARLRSDDVARLGDDAGSRVHVSVGGFFNASRIFTMLQMLREDFLIENPAHGVLFAIPNRHLVAVHPITGMGIVQATATLARLARGESEVPGAISPDVWLWRDGVVQQATRAGSDGAVELHVRGHLQDAMREVGLIDDSGAFGGGPDSLY